jgi:hypothetical protein
MAARGEGKMSVAQRINRWRNRADADVHWRRSFLERLADVDEPVSATPTSGAVTELHGVHAYHTATPESVLYGLADALGHLERSPKPAAEVQACAARPTRAATVQPPPAAPAIKLPVECLAYWDGVDANRELVRLVTRVQSRAQHSIRRGIILVAVSSVGIMSVVCGLIWVELSGGFGRTEEIATALHGNEVVQGQFAMLTATVSAKPVAPPLRRAHVTLTSLGPNTNSRSPEVSPGVYVPSSVFSRSEPAAAFTDTRSKPTAPRNTAAALEVKRSEPPATATRETPLAAKPIVPLSPPQANPIRIEPPAIAEVNVEGLVSVPLRVSGAGAIPADAFVLVEALPSGLVPAVGLHVAYGVWKLEPDEMESFSLVVGASAPEFFAFTVSIFATDSTPLGRSTAAVALRYSQRRQVTAAAPKSEPAIADKPAQAVATPLPKGAATGPQAETPSRPQRVAAKTDNFSNDGDDAEEDPKPRLARRAEPKVQRGEQHTTPDAVAAAKSQRREQPSTELKMGVGVRIVPPRPMGAKPVVAPAQLRRGETDWKQDVRDSMGTR